MRHDIMSLDYTTHMILQHVTRNYFTRCVSRTVIIPVQKDIPCPPRKYERELEASLNVCVALIVPCFAHTLQSRYNTRFAECKPIILRAS